MVLTVEIGDPDGPGVTMVGEVLIIEGGGKGGDGVVGSTRFRKSRGCPNQD